MKRTLRLQFNQVVIILTAILVPLGWNACGSPGSGLSQLGQTDLGSNDDGDDGGGSNNGGGGNNTPITDYVGSLKPLTSAQASKLVSEFIPQVANDGKDNRYSAALFGVAREMIEYKDIAIHFDDLEVAIPQLTKGKLPVQFHRSSKGKAPLAIILNPLYSGEFEAQMSRYKKFYGDKDFHILVFINTWSPLFIDRAPTFMPGDIWKEGQMHLQVIDKLVNEVIGKSNVTGATMVGLSYGAFMSSIVKYYDSQRSPQLITGPVMAVNPPHDIYNSLRNIDRQNAEVNGWTDGLACLLSGGFFNVMQMAAQYDDYNKTVFNEKCAKYVFVKVGFNETLKNAIRGLRTSKGITQTDAQIDAATYQNYMNNIAKLAPKAWETDIGYWMSEAQKTGYNKFLVVISQDDNINEGNSLATNAYFNFNATNLITLPTGGHTGFREGKSTNSSCRKNWESCLLNAVYY